MKITKSHLRRLIREAIWKTNLDDPDNRAPSLDQHLRRRSGRSHPQGPPRPIEGASYRANMDHLGEEDQMLFDEMYTFARQYIKMNMKDAIKSHQELRQAGFTPGGRLSWKAVETHLFNGGIDGTQDIIMAFDMDIGGSDDKMEMIGAVAALLDHAPVNEAWGGWTAKPRSYNQISDGTYQMVMAAKRQFMKNNPQASVSIDRKNGWVLINGRKAINVSSASGRHMDMQTMITKMEQSLEKTWRY